MSSISSKSEKKSRFNQSSDVFLHIINLLLPISLGHSIKEHSIIVVETTHNDFNNNYIYCITFGIADES